MADCKRCEMTVYAADRVEGAGAIWHKSCFVCEKCGCKLNPAILVRDPELFEIY